VRVVVSHIVSYHHIIYLYVLSFVLSCPLGFPHNRDVQFFLTLIVCRVVHFLVVSTSV
jgi:hypothetical protein